MKKGILALTLAASVMLTGAGYAYWTDSLAINNTVSTGEMKVEFIDKGQTGFPFGIAYDNAGEFAYVASEIDQTDAKTTTITLSNMYPGVVGSYFAVIENKGTIPAVFDNAVVSFGANTDQELKDDIWTVAGYELYDKDDQIKGANLAVAQSLDELQAQLTTLFSGLRLEPGDYIMLDVPEEGYAKIKEFAPGWEPKEGHSLHFIMPTTVENDDNAEDKTAEFAITINWKQHNAQ
ncbi:SipW-dependent-type signal peptide-containing protein [Desulfitobacterium sp. THU1]|uniref:SipW-dependent-type signal peptide-containing protein n=1 Tax=Desulfitobacterium sp. THU1 TaxID=3138072 RepID=UPI00311E8683